ncbi:hypothetical protein K466DRAFT_625751 [Polyporus arcularius HHB13444]|uniref:HAD-like protein n=1 Tax=Polyporus arcularius HHB13444 TaxID=1314778 RepID=A0A5C3PRG6_9APHY|nr:hypothetical protein K466DRAFT_625751 [Polyporus arcularius HHB13444]
MTHVSTRRAFLSSQDNVRVEEAIEDDAEEDWRSTRTQSRFDVWQMKACAIDRAVRILPGVKHLMDSLPEGRYAVTTSGAKTYAYGSMTRVAITLRFAITADDKRLKAGKPAPDPFLLAAKELGFDAHRFVVFEDTPSGIKACVVSGAIVIVLCSYERSKIANCGAHFIVEIMESREGGSGEWSSEVRCLSVI